MNNPLIRGVCVAGALAVVATIAVFASRSDSSLPQGNRSDGSAPAANAPPIRPIELLHAQRFHVAEAFQHVWRAEKPFYEDGWLLVLGCDPAALTVQQVRQPVLYVGEQTADRVNFGDESGRVVVIVPGDLDLAESPIFFGGVGLPEEVTHEQIASEVAAARRSGVAPHTAETIAAVLVDGVLDCENDYQLRLRAIDLVEQHSPQERDLIEGWRAPLVK